MLTMLSQQETKEWMGERAGGKKAHSCRSSHVKTLTDYM